MTKTFCEEIHDTYVTKNTEKQITVLAALGVVLKISVSKNFSNRHTTNIKQSHLPVPDIFIELPPTSAMFRKLSGKSLVPRVKDSNLKRQRADCENNSQERQPLEPVYFFISLF